MGAYANRAPQHIQVKRQKLDRFPKKSVKTRSFVSPITTTTIVFFLLLVFFSVEFCLCHWLPWHCADYHDKRRHIKIPLLPFQPYTRQKKSKLASFITSILSRFSRQLNFFFKKKIKKASLLIVFSLKLFFFYFLHLARTTEKVLCRVPNKQAEPPRRWAASFCSLLLLRFSIQQLSKEEEAWVQ